MLEEKWALIDTIEEKGLDIADLAKTIEFDPELLKLYLIKDTYPVPKRILDKVAEAINN